MTTTFTRMQALADLAYTVTVSSHNVGGLGHTGLTLAQRLPAHYSGAYAAADSTAYQQVPEPGWLTQSGHTAFSNNSRLFSGTPANGVLDPVTSTAGTVDVNKPYGTLKTATLNYSAAGYSHQLAGLNKYVRAVYDGG